MGKFIDLTGQKFGRLTAIYYDNTYTTKGGRKVGVWWCKCECNNENLIPVVPQNLKNGITVSCGCYKNELTVLRNTKLKKKYNNYDLSNDYGIGYTTKNLPFYFDIEDYDKIKNYCWRINNQGYVACSIKVEGRKTKKDILMHILILDGYDENFNIINKNLEIDHINGFNSRNDNRKNNLRQCTHSENLCNYTIPSNNTSGIIGVSFDKKYNTWKAYINKDCKKIHLGTFYNFEDAVKARLKAEKEYYGEFASQQYLYDKYEIS